MPGWSDHVNDKHEEARAAFLEWAARGKPRTGPTHLHMCRTRAAFKYAARACRTAVEQLKADARAKQLTGRKNTTNFWKGIAQDACKTKQLVTSIE